MGGKPLHLLFLFNLAIVVVIWLGALLAFYGLRRKSLVRVMLSFSSGFLLGVAFLHMLPEAWESLGGRAAWFVLAGYLLIYVLERFVLIHPCEEDDCVYHTLGLAAFVGLSLHTLMGGIALGASLLAPMTTIHSLAWAVFLATVIHKAPEAFSLTSILLLGKHPKARIIVLMMGFSAMIPVGSVLAFHELSSYGEMVVRGAIALSAGTFLNLGTRDLTSDTHHKDGHKMKTLLAFLAGVGFTVLLSFGGHGGEALQH